MICQSAGLGGGISTVVVCDGMGGATVTASDCGVSYHLYNTRLTVVITQFGPWAERANNFLSREGSRLSSCVSSWPHPLWRPFVAAVGIGHTSSDNANALHLHQKPSS